jgi:anti-sigma B factor antagonist
MSLTHPSDNYLHASAQPTTAPLNELWGEAAAALLRLHLAQRGYESWLITAAGEIDLATSPELRALIRDVLAKEGSRYLVIDLSAVTFLDSTGLGVLVWAHHRMRARSGDLTLAGPNETCLRLLELTQLARLIAIAPSVEIALPRAPHHRSLNHGDG